MPDRKKPAPSRPVDSASTLTRVLSTSGSDLANAMARIDKEGVPYLSFSKVSDLEFCEYRYVLSYVKDVRPAVEPAYFRKGHSFHRAVATFYEKGTVQETFEEHDEADRVHLRNAFHLAVQNAHAGWDVVAIEQPFVLDAGSAMAPCVGVIDLVLRREDTFAVVDHKTGSTFAELEPFQLAVYREHVVRSYGAKKCLAMFDQYRWVNSLDRIRKPAFQRVTLPESLVGWKVASARLAKAQKRIHELEAGRKAKADGPCFMCPLKDDCDRAYSRS